MSHQDRCAPTVIERCVFDDLDTPYNYMEIVPEIATEPNDDAALAAIKAATA